MTMTRHATLALTFCSACLLAVPARSLAQDVKTTPTAQAELDPQDVAPPAQPKPATGPADRKEQAERKEQKERAEADRKTETMPPARQISTGPNVRVELTLTDQKTGAETTSKTVMITTNNGTWGRLRSEVTSREYGNAPLNVDALPLVLPDGRIALSLTVEYSQGQMPEAKGNTDRIWQVRLNESLTTLLENGKALLVTQSADPISDRKVTVEVKATVIK